MGEFKLSAALAGHEDDVRGVVFPNSKFIASASRDATVRTWKLLSSALTPEYDCTISSHGTTFVNAITYIPPSASFKHGLIVSGGKDTVIEVREPDKRPEENAERLLTGHAHTVCSLDVSPNGDWIVSGSWDASARVWSVGKWSCEAVLEDHEGSVLSVLAYDPETIVTACADKYVRIFSVTGKLHRRFQGSSSDVVRALCKIPSGHPSGADIASAGNDGVIRLWKLSGEKMGELHGHDSFIYSLAALPDGDLISSGEDRTVRVWRGFECFQTITHPAISVWDVAVCAQNGDIVSGASDRIVRVFTREKDREADAVTIQAFQEAVKDSAIPQQQVGQVNKEKLPGPEFLVQKAGTKEGQVVMIREQDGSVTAHTWSSASSQWVNVGTVVDAEGSSGKKIAYLGQDYDYVFDVDIEEGKPPLKLPYNLSQNPYQAATKFIEDNELPIGYLDQVADFIVTNTKGATIQNSSAPPTAPGPGADPWGSESRYRPGESSASATQAVPITSPPRVLPQKSYLSIKSANIDTILKKIGNLNDELIKDGAKETWSVTDLSVLQKLKPFLERALASTSSTDVKAPADIHRAIDMTLAMISNWPPPSRLPALDLLRLLAAATPALAQSTTSAGNLIATLEESGSLADADRPNNSMLAIRTFANLFETPAGRTLADENFDRIHRLVQIASNGWTNRNLNIAATTLYINYAVLATSVSHRDFPSSIDRALALTDDLITLLKVEKDSEVVYRSLVGLGTFLPLGEEVTLAAKEIYGLDGVLKTLASRFEEPRIKGVIEEMRTYLG